MESDAAPLEVVEGATAEAPDAPPPPEFEVLDFVPLEFAPVEFPVEDAVAFAEPLVLEVAAADCT